MRIGLAQINPVVGDLEGNRKKILKRVEEGKRLGVDLIAFPELCLTGYPPEDLLLKPQFIKDNIKTLEKIEEKCVGITALVGFVDKSDDIYNAAALIHDGELAGIYHKMFLPNYGVFDEDRYFQAGDKNVIFELDGVRIGVSICEDIWYPKGPVHVQSLAGAQIAINLNASPYHAGKRNLKEKMISTRAFDNELIIAYVNMVGGQDELVFDGQSFVVNECGEITARAKAFEEELLVVDVNPESVFRTRLHDPRRRKEILKFKGDQEVVTIKLKKVARRSKPRIKTSLTSPLQEDEEVYKALVVGTRDYVRKNGFKGVLIGLSGGIDSSLTAAIAVDALGRENVTGVLMPSRYTSRESVEDALELSENLGIKTITISIEGIFDAYLRSLSEVFKQEKPDVTEENIQARIRGNILMALSNKFGSLVLTTGNKSEMSVGYATLYGDMAGGFAVLKDVFKTRVYRLALYRNSLSPVIPQRVLEKPPSAELRPNQKDQDTLPPYEVLDPILKSYVEDDVPYEGILNLGFDEKTVRKVVTMVDRNEYKRRQAPPGVKITPRALGKDRKMPITNRYRSF